MVPRSQLESGNIQIVGYKPQYAQTFRDINYEWLEEFFEIEPYDRIVLGDPKKHILDHDGHLFFALVDNKVVGTCALQRHTEVKYELAKMGVTGGYRRRGVGRCLVEAAIDKARSLGATTLVLATSEKLTAANHLYASLGFQKANLAILGPLPYKRKTIAMSMKLMDSD